MVILLEEYTEADQHSIGDSEEALGRMLGTLRFWFTKDLVRMPHRSPARF